MGKQTFQPMSVTISSEIHDIVPSTGTTPSGPALPQNYLAPEISMYHVVPVTAILGFHVESDHLQWCGRQIRHSTRLLNAILGWRIAWGLHTFVDKHAWALNCDHLSAALFD